MSGGNVKDEEEAFDIEEFVSLITRDLWQIKASLLGDGNKLKAAYHLGELIQYVHTVEENLNKNKHEVSED